MECTAAGIREAERRVGWDDQRVSRRQRVTLITDGGVGAAGKAHEDLLVIDRMDRAARALAYQGFVDELHVALRQRGFADLARSDGYVFRLLDAESRTVSAIASVLGMSKQGAAQLVGDMEARGYVERVPHPDDRRAWQVTLTRRGRRALTAARAFHRLYERRLMTKAGRAPVLAMRALLVQMVEAGGTAATHQRVRPT